MAVDPSEGERIGTFAARVLEDLYAVVYGERPVGVRVWCDGSALLMVLRLAGSSEDGATEPGTALPCEAIPELVATAVREQLGWDLSVGSAGVEAELGLVMLVFRLPETAPEQPQLEPAAMTAVAAAGERDGRRLPRWQALHTPSWRSWTPVPPSGVVPAPERRRLRLVED